MSVQKRLEGAAQTVQAVDQYLGTVMRLRVGKEPPAVRSLAESDGALQPSSMYASAMRRL
jgi:hypothetical protein